MKHHIIYYVSICRCNYRNTLRLLDKTNPDKNSVVILPENNIKMCAKYVLFKKNIVPRKTPIVCSRHEVHDKGLKYNFHKYVTFTNSYSNHEGN